MDSKLRTKLDTLELYLSHLPDSLHLPEPNRATYPFDLLEISSEDLEDYGETGAVNRELELAFGSRHNGPIVLVERGPVLVQVVDLLRTYLQKDPNSAVLQKWVDDLTTLPATHLMTAMHGLTHPDDLSQRLQVLNELCSHSVGVPTSTLPHHSSETYSVKLTHTRSSAATWQEDKQRITRLQRRMPPLQARTGKLGSGRSEIDPCSPRIRVNFVNFTAN